MLRSEGLEATRGRDPLDEIGIGVIKDRGKDGTATGTGIVGMAEGGEEGEIGVVEGGFDPE